MMFRRCASLVLTPKTTTTTTTTSTRTFATTLRCLAPTAFSNAHIHVETDDRGVTVLSFQSAPVNVVTTEFMASFNNALETLRTPFSDGHEADGYNQNESGKQNVTRALILTSAIPNTFLAGLDLKQMIDPQIDTYLPFRYEIAKNWHLMMHFPVPVLSVITGQCPGQGTVTAVACDYRVMVEKSTKPGAKPFLIGLNEAAIGLMPPPHASASFVDLIKERRIAYDMLLLGTMIPAAEAVEIGLVDASAPDKETAMAIAEKKALQYAAVRPAVLRELRRHFITEKYNFLDFNDTKAVEEGSRHMYKRVCDPVIQATLKGYVAKLGGKKKK